MSIGCFVLAEPLEVVEFLGFVELAALGELIHVAEKSVSSMEPLKSLKSSTSLTLGVRLSCVILWRKTHLFIVAASRLAGGSRQTRCHQTV